MWLDSKFVFFLTSGKAMSEGCEVNLDCFKNSRHYLFHFADTPSRALSQSVPAFSRNLSSTRVTALANIRPKPSWTCSPFGARSEPSRTLLSRWSETWSTGGPSTPWPRSSLSTRVFRFDTCPRRVSFFIVINICKAVLFENYTFFQHCMTTFCLFAFRWHKVIL